MRLVRGRALVGGGIVEAPVGIDGSVFGKGGREVEASGYLLLPGIVDAHGDGFERHLAPRRGLVSDSAIALHHASAELAACGVTTAFLAQFWSWEGGMRSPAFARRVAEALASRDWPLDLRLQLRFETHFVDDAEAMLAFVDEFRIGYVSFNDHVPHELLDAGKLPKRLAGTALKSGRNPEAHLAIMLEMHANAPRVDGMLREVTTRLAARGARMASHDDTGPRDMWRDLGVEIAEFPEVMAGADGPVVMGAPNVVRGNSHNGAIAASEVIAAGRCTALASDYHYPSLARAAFRLSDDGICDFAEAWAYVSERPAKMLGLADRGRIEDGKRADLVVIHEGTRRIEGCLAAGRPAYLAGELAQRCMR